MVVPAATEDDQSKAAKKKKKDQPSSQLVTIPAQDTSTSISPVRKQNKEQMRRLSTVTKTKMPVKGMKKEGSKQNLKPMEEEKKEEIQEEEVKPEEPAVVTSN